MFAFEVEFLSRAYLRDRFRGTGCPGVAAASVTAVFSTRSGVLRIWVGFRFTSCARLAGRQKSPDIWAGRFVTRLESAAGSRFSQPKTPGSFVPINDDYSGKFPNSAGRRKERWFPSGYPEDERVQFIWRKAVPTPVTIDALRRIAAQVSYLGHSSSLVRVA